MGLSQWGCGAESRHFTSPQHGSCKKIFAGIHVIGYLVNIGEFRRCQRYGFQNEECGTFVPGSVDIVS